MSRKRMTRDVPTCGDDVFEGEMPLPCPNSQRNLKLPEPASLRNGCVIGRDDDGLEIELISRVGLHVRTCRYSNLKKRIHISHIDADRTERSIDFTYGKLSKDPAACAEKLRKHGVVVNADKFAEDIAMKVLLRTLEQNEPCRSRNKGSIRNEGL